MREQQAYSDVINLSVPSQRQSTGTSAGIHPDDENSYPTAEQVPPRRRKPLADDYDDEPVSQLPCSSVRRNVTSATTQQPPTRQIHVVRHPYRASRLPVPVPQVQEKARTRIRLPLRTYVIGFLILAIVGWLLINIVLSVIHNVSDNLTYGNPRTYHTDKDVGHEGISHFIATNLQGHIIVVEIVNSDVTKTHIYSIVVLTGDNASTVPVTLSFESHANPNLLDMMVTVNGFKYDWPNDGKEFQPDANQTGSHS